MCYKQILIRQILENKCLFAYNNIHNNLERWNIVKYENENCFYEIF